MKQIFVLVGAILIFIIAIAIYIYVLSLGSAPLDQINYSVYISPTLPSTPLPSFHSDDDSSSVHPERVHRERERAVQATPTEVQLPISYEIPGGTFVAQTFNNCGPATLSMAMSYWGIQVSQNILGEKMRPYQNPTGDNDDKSISVEEFVEEAENQGLKALARPNGTVELVRKFVANNIPIIVRTWLHPNEDIGHFRIVRGYNDEKRVFIQDDSYEGKNLTYDYDTFLSMWQPFNYGYILVYPKEKESLVKEILGEEFDEKIAYKNSIVRAQQELVSSTSAYPHFNLSSAYYHLGNYQQSVNEFEKVEKNLPWRMLWYQIEPIAAYKETGNSERVFNLTEKILNNNNKAFSELYQMRGEVYLQQGKREEAIGEFEKALFYNIYFKPAQESLAKL